MGAQDTAGINGNGFPAFQWPTDENGKEKSLVGFQMAELVPTVQFGNATIGPAFAMTWTEDTPEGRKEGIQQCVNDVREIMAKERNTTLAVLREKRIHQAQQS